MIDELITTAAKKKIVPKDEAEKQETIKDLRFMLKALIAYNVWDRSEYFQMLNQKNDVVLRALRELGVQPAVAGGKSRSGK